MLATMLMQSKPAGLLALEDAFAPHVAAVARGWFETWQVAPLADAVRVRYSPRMFRAIGRAHPLRCLVTLAAGVRALPEPTVLDILAHEFAHLAAYARHGRGIRPHGREWASLMRGAGFQPRVRFADEVAIDIVRAHARIPLRYLHQCRVCGASRESSRPMRRWRCGACYEIGLDGRLEILRVGG